MTTQIKRRFELKLSYTSDASSFDINAFDVVIADNLVSLLSQFNIVIASLHQRILNEERMEKGIIDDDIPF